VRVAVLSGGPSREREVSMWSGAEVLKSLGASGVDVVVGEAGTWTVAGRERASFADASAALRGFDAAFIALHGAFGEDGTVQALLESIGLPYTGSRPAASALAMDKIRTKLVYRGAGLPTAPSVDRLAGDDVEGVLRRVAADLLGPWVVKPASEGSSFGVSFC
jgi:D-alanine-D-alanine ligase